MSEALRYSITKRGFREAENPSVVTPLEHWILVRAIDDKIDVPNMVSKSMHRTRGSQFDPAEIVDSVYNLVDLGMLKEVQ